MPEEGDAFVREHKERHYVVWLDMALPTLGNKTPRQAARSRQGRHALTLLLKDSRISRPVTPAATRFDVGVTWRALGIEEE